MSSRPSFSTHRSQPEHHSLIARAASPMHSMALAFGFLARFAALSALACLLVSTPMSLREVPYASHRPSTGH